MSTVVLVIVLGALVVGVAALVRSRLRVEAPTRAGWSVPAQLDRADFDRPDAPWVVVVFTSTTCAGCRGTADKAEALASDAVVVHEVSSPADQALHDRYGVEAVPMVAVADHQGVVRASFLGEPTAAELWSTMADLRDDPET